MAITVAETLMAAMEMMAMTMTMKNPIGLVHQCDADPVRIVFSAILIYGINPGDIGRPLKASFSGPFLNCVCEIKTGKKRGIFPVIHDKVQRCWDAVRFSVTAQLLLE